MELLFERVDGEVFDNVDMDVGDKLEVEEGADACTKSFKLVDDVDAFTWVLLGVLLEVTLGVKVVLLVCEEDALEIGTCFTVMVVPDGMFLVKFLFSIKENIQITLKFRILIFFCLSAVFNYLSRHARFTSISDFFGSGSAVSFSSPLSSFSQSLLWCKLTEMSLPQDPTLGEPFPALVEQRCVWEYLENYGSF